MKNALVVRPGLDSSDFQVVRSIASEFGWEVGENSDRIVAVLLRREGSESWSEAVRRAREAWPGVPIVTCHGFIEQIDWGELYDLQTFHAIRMPMSESEVRQSLGFLWAAEQRTAARMPIPIQRRSAEHASAFGAGFSYAAG